MTTLRASWSWTEGEATISLCDARFWLGLAVATLVALAACAPGSQPLTSSPAPAVAPQSSPTPAFVPSGVPPDSDERFQDEMRQARFQPLGWRTNFRVHSVPLSEFRGGGPGRDDIPSIDHPRFVSVKEANSWLNDREPVQVVELNGDARAYPQQVLVWHEVVNDTVGGVPVTITY